jgi:hypothetical protein
MKKQFIVTVSQWVQEMAQMVYRAKDERDAIDKALTHYHDGGDWDWTTGDTVRDFEVIDVEEIGRRRHV